MAPEPRLLDATRVIDAAGFIAGPVATTMTADFGADVVKGERLLHCGVIVRHTTAESLAERRRAQLAQVIGRTALLYRPRHEDPTIVPPVPRRG